MDAGVSEIPRRAGRREAARLGIHKSLQAATNSALRLYLL
jgi:hypothetical protein